MLRYIVRRLLQSAVLLFLISVALFVLMNESGDPLATLGGRQPPRPEDRARLECQLGLDQPVLTQYLYWLIGNTHTETDCDNDGEFVRGTREGVLRGDFGMSIVTREPAMDVILDRLPNTLLLTGTAQILIILISLCIGILSAVKQYSIFDHALTGFSFVMYSMPVFFVGIMLVYIFAVRFREWGLPYLPSSKMYEPAVGRTTEQVVEHMILPVATLVLIGVASYTRYVRAAMLEVLGSDYIRTARAKGLEERRVLFIHALKNAILPVVTLIGLDLPFLLAGAVVTEQIFAWPGMGQLFVNHLNRSDIPVLMGLLMMISVAVVIFQLLTDIVYTFLDPRIRLS